MRGQVSLPDSKQAPGPAQTIPIVTQGLSIQGHCQTQQTSVGIHAHAYTHHQSFGIVSTTSTLTRSVVSRLRSGRQQAHSQNGNGPSHPGVASAEPSRARTSGHGESGPVIALNSPLQTAELTCLRAANALSSCSQALSSAHGSASYVRAPCIALDVGARCVEHWTAGTVINARKTVHFNRR